jgi:acetyl-CoA C-acetyltransferase
MHDHPVIIGVGQITDRTTDPAAAPHPLQLALRASLAAAEDTGSTGILGRLNAVSVVNIFSWKYRDPAGQLCEMLGINPPMREYTCWGGNVPQWLVNRAADMIARGEIEAALIVGAEALSASKGGMAQYLLNRPPLENPAVELIGDNRYGSSPHEMLHNASVPIQVYPLFENALRAELRHGIEEHGAFIAELWAGFSRVASGNPLAWFREPVTSREILEVSEKNRMIGFPYTKRMNPMLSVNQSAALIITGARTATRLSIPREKWVYLRGGADAVDKWNVSERVSYTRSPAIREVGSAAMSMAGISIGDIDFFDLYSCFPGAVVIGALSLGLDIDNLSPLTITGGLAYFGGPGNNYTMHAIAHAVERLRKKPGEFGYVTGLGWYITKHSAGIYSGTEPERPWMRDQHDDIQRRIDEMEGPALELHPDGPVTVETYTVMHNRQGEPDFAIVIARLENGDRCMGMVRNDQDLLKAMEKEEFIGRNGTISPGDNAPNIVRFLT